MREETKGALAISPSNCLAILQHETDTNYTMVVFLGVPADSDNPATGNDEGRLRWFSLDDLPDLLADDGRDWVCTGKQATLVWLALGCPVGGDDFAFGRRKAAQLLDKYQALTRRANHAAR